MKEFGIEKVVVVLVIGYLGAKFVYPILDSLWKKIFG